MAIGLNAHQERFASSQAIDDGRPISFLLARETLMKFLEDKVLVRHLTELGIEEEGFLEHCEAVLGGHTDVDVFIRSYKRTEEDEDLIFEFQFSRDADGQYHYVGYEKL